MKYRWKLLILLLCISITPIVGIRFFGVNAVRNLGSDLVLGTQEKLIIGYESRLKLLIDTYSQMLWRGREQIEMALMMQADEVERALGRTPPISEKVYFSSDFNNGGNLPADTIPSSVHYRSFGTEDMTSLTVSHTAQVFKLAPGVEQSRVAEDIGRLNTMTPASRRLYKRIQEEVIWQYVILTNGLHASYPGHSGIPDRLDLRDQPWFKPALNGSTQWTDPYVDPETRQIVVSAVRPVSRPDGLAAGVAAMVVPINQLLNQRLLVKNIPRESKAFLCYRAIRPETGRPGVRILARQDYDDISHRSWRAQLEPEWLESPNTGQIDALLNDVATENGNIRRLAYQGCSCLWAYGPTHSNAFLVVIIPETEILKPIVATETRIQERIDSLIRMTGWGMICVVLLIILVAFAFSRTVTRPLQALVDGTMRLAKGNFDTRVDIRSRDEFGEMGHVFNSVVPRMEEYYRMSRSMALAREVQRNLLPVANPEIDGLDIAGLAISCDEIGGDYYDFLYSGHRKQGKIAVVVGDVSDHGLPSALLMASARAYLRQRNAMPGRISDMVADVNRQLTRDVEDSGRFMTLFYSEFDPWNSTVQWVRAGHDPAIFYDPETDRFEELGGKGPALGIDKNVQYEETRRKIRPGQIIVVATDGIWETHDATGKMYGKQRLRRVIRDQCHESAVNILKKVISDLERFRREAVQEDDVTLVVIKMDTQPM